MVEFQNESNKKLLKWCNINKVIPGVTCSLYIDMK